MATDNMCRKFGEVWMCSLLDMTVNRQRDRQTIRHTDTRSPAVIKDHTVLHIMEVNSRIYDDEE